jgi:acyl-CoA synthetase (AMP-forming)/AMP-acid ligase II
VSESAAPAQPTQTPCWPRQTLSRAVAKPPELRDSREPVTADALLAHAAATLARYELPAEIRIVDELPRTASAKVDLAAVTALFAEA